MGESALKMRQNRKKVPEKFVSSKKRCTFAAQLGKESMAH